MKLFTKNNKFTIYNDSCLKMLEDIECNSIDSIVTDPPYELGFMGKSWDSTGIAFQKETWEKCYQVLKPGGYLLAFGGSRTFHRIACAIEDAGFEIRDTIMWIYGSGFPKSMNIGLSVDKKNGVESEVIGTKTIKKLPTTGIINYEKEGWRKGGYDIEYVNKKAQNEWNGWGTALKPAFEPVIVARKPREGSTTDNVLKYGVGGINIEECRVGITDEVKMNIRNTDSCGDGWKRKWMQDKEKDKKRQEIAIDKANNLGRFPANLILTYDDSDYEEVCGGFPSDDNNNSASRYFYCAKATKRDRDEGLNDFKEYTTGVLQGGRKEGSAGSIMQNVNGGTRVNPYAGAAVPKKNVHPTVKPTSLMSYLVRLVTPKGGIVLDPFMGSGSTGKATMYENVDRGVNYKFIGIELQEEYCKISEARIEFAMHDSKKHKEFEKSKEENEDKQLTWEDIDV